MNRETKGSHSAAAGCESVRAPGIRVGAVWQPCVAK
jgi:hypothetical protein